MPILDENEHLWAQQRLEWHQAGVLETEDDRRLSGHLAGCDDCRRALQAIATSAPPIAEAGHVPASVLARWPGVRANMPQLESELIEQHLRECEGCRAELELTQAARSAAYHHVSPRESHAPRRPLWLGAWATTATAAAAGLALLWWTTPRERPPVTVAAAARGPALRVAPAAVRLHDVMRGGAASSPTQVEPGPYEPVVLAFDPAAVPDETPIALEIATAAGPTLARTVRPQGELYPARVLLVGDETRPLGDGDYQLRVIAWPGSARADTQSYAFTVRRRH